MGWGRSKRGANPVDAGSSQLRERLIYFVIVPAVIVAVLVLGGLAVRTNLRIERARRQTLLDATATLASERATLLDNQLIAQDNVIAAHLDAVSTQGLRRRWLQSAARETPSVRSVLVVDLSSPNREVTAHVSRFPSRDDDIVRRVLVHRLIGAMNLAGDTTELRHLHDFVDDRPVLVSYWQRDAPRGRELVVLWHDVDRIVRELMPQLFRDAGRGNARMNVIDERGRIVFGPPIKVGEFTVGLPFPTTLYAWRLQVAITSAEEVSQSVERRRFFELGLVAVAGVVTLAGLVIIIAAASRERRVATLKSDFVANVSHELKTPLSLIRMFGELLLLERVRSDDKRRQYLSIIVSESERLTALIENVLDFARTERGKAAYDFAEASIADVARRAVEIYRYRAERDEVEIVLDDSAAPGPIRIDARALELGVMNLLDNGLKYAREGRKLEVTVAAADGFATVTVTDFGPGIPLDEQRRIFERFYRGSGSGGRARGSGIGLSLVQSIAEAHGGKVTVESPARGGAAGCAFTIALPVARRAPS